METVELTREDLRSPSRLEEIGERVYRVIEDVDNELRGLYDTVMAYGQKDGQGKGKGREGGGGRNRNKGPCKGSGQGYGQGGGKGKGKGRGK